MDLGAWLKQNGFERYEAAFRDNGIDEAVLPHLTAEDLKEIGVATVGDRRKLLAAVAALPSPTASGESAAPRPPPAPPKRVPEISAERRPITVMFCDLVGSTALASRLDAEDWRSLANAYLDEASAAVTGLGGHVLKRLGDGLMALFGYPTAQENDAERAVRAALAIQRALSEINARNASKGAPELSARIELEVWAGRGRDGGRGVRRRAEYRRSRAGGGRPWLGARHQECSAPGLGALCRRRPRRARTQGSDRAGPALPHHSS